MKKNRKLFLILGGVLVVLVVLALIKRSTEERGEKVAVETVEKRNIISVVSANGKVQPEIEVKISADVSGEIIELMVKDGDSVKKGDFLLRINPDLSQAALDRAEASLNTVKANLANSRAREAQAKARLLNETASYNRNKSLLEKKAISQAEYDAAEAAFQVAQLEVQAAEQSVVGLEFNVKSAEASLKEANDNLLRTTIFAPLDGAVSSLSIEQGERVVGTSQMEGTELLRIADFKDMEVNVEVNENDIVKVRRGNLAEIEVDAYPDRKFKGQVMEMANSANVTGATTDQVTTFFVKIRILRSSYEDLLDPDNPHLSPFRPGMSASVDIQTGQVENAVSVPIQSITTREPDEDEEDKDENQDEEKDDLIKYVFVYKDGIVERREVESGIQDRRYIEVTEGLEAGEVVVSAPYTVIAKKLEDGDKVIETDKKDLYKD